MKMISRNERIIRSDTLAFHGATFVFQDVQSVEQMAHASGGHRQLHLIMANDGVFGTYVKLRWVV